MDAVAAYSWGSLVWLGSQALPLIIWPTFISSVLSDDYQHGNIVESYFARSLGFSQLTIGLMLVVLSGSLPLTSVLDSPNDAVSPYAAAVILVSMAHHATAAFYTWARFHSSGQTGFMLGCIGNTVFAAYALWVLMFGSEKVQISRRTGANKRTSGWPFKNAEADKRFADKRNR